MPIPYTPLASANYFIAKFAAPRGIEHMKLQKLVYFSHGWWLTEFPEPYLNERPQIWRHGPVFNSLYHVLKTFGGTPIVSVQAPTPFSSPPMIGDDSAEIPTLLDWIWQKYGHLSSFALSDMTHSEGTAWSRVAAERGYSVPHGLEIPDVYIREEFTKQRLVDSDLSESELGESTSGRGRTAA